MVVGNGAPVGSDGVAVGSGIRCGDLNREFQQQTLTMRLVEGFPLEQMTLAHSTVLFDIKKRIENGVVLMLNLSVLDLKNERRWRKVVVMEEGVL
ncbi:hypothetical protein Tco_0843551 [Tanacetum coccineum]|uniref:Uncharacterized protein n=1 Tax=Tanacetum coccineum TaxID=301880 RepID=A0ABQ5B6P4_9ASTR